MRKLLSVASIGAMFLAAPTLHAMKGNRNSKGNGFPNKKAEVLVLGSCTRHCPSGKTKIMQIVKTADGKHLLQETVNGVEMNEGEGVPLKLVLDTKTDAMKSGAPNMKIFKTAFDGKALNSELNGPTFNHLNNLEDTDESSLVTMEGPPLKREYFGIRNKKVVPFNYNGNYQTNRPISKTDVLAFNKETATALGDESRILVVRKGKHQKKLVHRLIEAR